MEKAVTLNFGGRVIDKLLINVLKDNKPPYNIVVDIVETPQYIALRVYENEIMSLSNDRQALVMEYLHRLRGIVTDFGIKCHFQGVPGDPPRKL